jgi:2-iminobutanoate/2-iminopropanoate deaminase
MRAITTSAAPPARGHYSQAMEHAGTLYVAGQLPIDPAAAERRIEGFEAQARQVIANVIAIVEAAGSARENILRTTVYIADISHWPAFNAIYTEMMGGHRPARTVVPVPQLHYGYLVEMDAIAAVMPAESA